MISEGHRSPSWPDLPFDIAEEIVAFYNEDRSTLFTLALTSQTLRSAALVHLYSEIDLSSQSDFDQWESMVARSPELGNRIVKTVRYDPLRQSRGRKQPLDPYMQYNIPEEMFRKPRPQSPPRYPYRIAQIPSVTTLHCFGQPSPISFLSLFPNMTHLRLRTCTLDHWLEVTDYISSCPRLLKHLALEHVSLIGAYVPESVSARCDLSELETLALLGHESGLDELFRHITIPPLRSLNLGDDKGRPACSPAVFLTLLQASAHSLEHLVIDPTMFDGPADFKTIAQYIEQIPSFPELRSLSLWCSRLSHPELFLEKISSAPALTYVGIMVAEIESALTIPLFIWRTGQEMIFTECQRLPNFKRLSFKSCWWKKPSITTRTKYEVELRRIAPQLGGNVVFQFCNYAGEAYGA
ncbi:hypothetical protein C8J56DRAFT_958271 [Mycena floridula]|nr:hypothetical protein C8J56DRAFT_958271 [Mycena floridula]